MVIPDGDNTDTENSNIVAAYTYNESTCVTGEESTCVSTTCYKTKTSGSCPSGTIIKYKVNDSTTNYFYVLHDDGDTMTLQQRENTTDGVVWYYTLDSSGNPINYQGPIQALELLESSTSSWTNVNNLNYTMGTTNFNNTNAYTGCSGTNYTACTCTTNTYTLSGRTAKARMITVQEATVLGCIYYKEGSCPVWMHNYLASSTEYGGTVDVDDPNHTHQGYWTMSASTTRSDYAFFVAYTGYTFDGYTRYENFGTRAVVEINKE